MIKYSKLTAGEIAKEALIRQYELNYLEARRKYGKATAEKLFPRSQLDLLYLSGR